MSPKHRMYCGQCVHRVCRMCRTYRLCRMYHVSFDGMFHAFTVRTWTLCALWYIPRLTHVPRVPCVLYEGQVSYVTLRHVTYVLDVQHLTVITFNVRSVFYVQQMCCMKRAEYLYCMCGIGL